MDESKLLLSKEWRLNHLYRIVDRNGDSIRFRLNPVQANVLRNIHTRNIILKARQLGMSTFSVLYMLDETIFNANTSAGIVSYSLEHAQHIFKRIIGHALDSLTPIAKDMVGIIQRSAREISFANGSFLRVDTTLRGGAYQNVLVSEFGKTCARNPLKAEEVITGTLNTLAQTSTCIIESTGEGNEGYYAEMVTNAAQHGNKDLSPLQYKLFFFNWLEEPTYKSVQNIVYEVELTDYFDKVEKETGQKIAQDQRNWYAIQRTTLGDKMKQEFPSTVAEAFISSSDAYYFQRSLEKAYSDNRVLTTSLYDPLEAVYVAMDIGVNDLTVMTFFQVIHGEIRVIDYYHDNNKGVDFYVNFLLQDKRYTYRTIFLPHDSRKRDGVVVENIYEREFRRLMSHTGVQVTVLKRTDKNLNISNAKIKFDRCVFSLKKVKPLLDQLTKYRKKWSEQYGKYLDEPYHNIASNFADSFIYAMQGVSHVEVVGTLKGSLKKHREAVESRYKRF